MQDHSSSQTAGMRRRDFLKMGATAVLVPLASELAGSATLIAPTAPQAEPMSVGYLQGSYELASFDRLPWGDGSNLAPEAAAELEVVPASSLLLGDQDLAGGQARLRIHGLFPDQPARVAKSFDAVDLEVLFPSPDPGAPAPIPFFAWSFRRLPGLNVSQRLALSAPIGPGGRLDLALEIVQRRSAAAAALLGPAPRRRLETSFTVGWEHGRPKLQRGIYLLGLLPSAWNAPRALAAASGGAAALCSLVLSVEPAARA